MAKRTPGLETVETILPKSIHALGPKVEKRYRRHFVLWHWKDIVGDAIASNVLPMGIEHERLWLYAKNATWRNEVQMMQPEILQKVNNCAGERLVREMRFGRKWERLSPGKEPSGETGPEFHLGREIERMNLSDPELSSVKDACSSVEDEELKKKIQLLLIKNKKLTKLKQSRNWHPCRDCGALCPDGASRCSICASRHEGEIRRAVRKLLQELPWLRYGELRGQIPECTPYMVNSLRASMVQELAMTLKLEDYKTLGAKRLVMLHLCLPPEQLTEDLVKRTLYSFRRDLSRSGEFKPLKRYDYLPQKKRKAGGPRVPSSGK